MENMITQQHALDAAKEYLCQMSNIPEHAWTSEARMLARTVVEFDRLRARVAELEAATALTPSHLLDELADLRRDRERLAGVARRQYWALREGDNIVRHIRSTIFPGWTNLSDHDVNACLREYESEHGIDANYVKRNAARAKDAKTEGGV